MNGAADSIAQDGQTKDEQKLKIICSVSAVFVFIGIIAGIVILKICVDNMLLSAPPDDDNASEAVKPQCVAAWVASDCSEPCGPQGLSTHTYVMTTAGNTNGQPLCEPPAATAFELGSTEIHACNTDILCPVDCTGAFTEWSACSLPCGGGTQVREFIVTAVAEHGGECPSLGVLQTQDCNTDACPPPPPDPVSCVGDFGEFGECSDPCGPSGLFTRTFIVETAASHGGLNCIASAGDIDTQPCNTDVECPRPPPPPTVSTLGLSNDENSRGVVVCDFNNDGLDDAFIVNGANNNAQNELLIGNGHGGFTSSRPGRRDPSMDVACGDFNNDGNQDVIIANHRERNELLLGDGAGGFASSRLSRSDQSMNVVVADFNGDGNLDAFFINATPWQGDSAANEVLLGDGAGGFTSSLLPIIGDTVSSKYITVSCNQPPWLKKWSPAVLVL
eukprot:COSAG06_NODE_412_length_16042_cov_52.419934_15_plen_446_part_00